MEKTSIEKELSGYIGRLFRENFGRGPGNVNCTYEAPFITVHITSFLSQMEKALLDNNNAVYVQKTRDFLMESLINDITSYVELQAGEQVDRFHYDWNLEEKSGMILMVLKDSHRALQLFDAPYPNKGNIHREIENISTEAQKEPDQTLSAVLKGRQLLIIREGILVSIEKEFINLGFRETLKIAKRKLEKTLIAERKGVLEKELEADVTDVFVDWDFERDKGYTLVMFKPKNP